MQDLLLEKDGVVLHRIYLIPLLLLSLIFPMTAERTAYDSPLCLWNDVGATQAFMNSKKGRNHTQTSLRAKLLSAFCFSVQPLLLYSCLMAS